MSKLQARIQSVNAKIAALNAASATIAPTLETIDKAVQKGAMFKPTLKNLEKAYLDTIKAADGLTSARPSTLKEIKAATANPSVATLDKAKSEIAKHLQELKKTSGSDKRFGKFNSACTALAQKIDKVIG